MVGIADSSTLARSIIAGMPNASEIGTASAGITSSLSASPVASGRTSSRGRRSWIDSPTASITSGSIASASRRRPEAIHSGGCSGITVRPSSSAQGGGKRAIRSRISRTVGAASPL